MSHTCRTGKHGWTDPINAERCCSGEWIRVMRHIHNTADLDTDGRVYLYGDPQTVYGWIRSPTTTKQEDVLC